MIYETSNDEQIYIGDMTTSIIQVNTGETLGKFALNKQNTITGKWHGCNFKKSV